MFTAYLSLGSNLGERLEHLRNAITKLKQSSILIEDVSPIYESNALGFTAEKKFLNLCLKVKTSLPAIELLSKCLEIELAIGRVRNFNNTYTSRVIDIDVLFFEDCIIESQVLTLPHPRFFERKFVLVPLFDIAPDLEDPKSKCTISKLLANCKDESKLILSFHQIEVF